MTSAVAIHEEDAGILLVFVILLTCVVITIWALKKKSVRFLHETGLALIYGLIVGAIIRYATPSNPDGNAKNDVTACENLTRADDIIIVKINDSEYSYKLQGEISDDDWQYQFAEELDKITFDPEIFFNILLPPIIFNAGYSMKKRHFFRNIGAITLFAFVGTTISTFCVAGLSFVALQLSKLALLAPDDMGFGHCLQFGAMISATDPVTVLAVFKDLKVEPNLDALLFGESVLNDAVAIVLSQTFTTVLNSKSETSAELFGYAILNFFTIFVGSLLIGASIALITALVFKFFRFDGMEILETGLFFLLSWSSFLFAETLGLTGIVSVLFCGILQAHYTYNNLTPESKQSTKQLMELLNFLAENFLFIYMGISVFSFSHHRWDPFFTIFAFLGIILGRLINVYPLAGLINLNRNRRNPETIIPCKFQHMMMFSGLRGAVAFALALRDTSSPANQLMFSTTLLIVYVTVLFLGGGTTAMLTKLQIPVGCSDELEERTDSEDQNMVWRGWYKFDKIFMKPILTHRGPPLTQSCPSVCNKLAQCFTSPEAYSSTDYGQDDQEVILDADELAFGQPDA